MKAMQHTALVLALAGALAIPATTLLAGEPPKQDEHSAHHPDAVQTQATASADPMQAMRERMRQMRQTHDPRKRMRMMDAQMQDMEAMMRDPSRGCPMVDGKGGGMGMKGGNSSGMAMSGQDDMMAKRMDMMQKRMGSGMQGGPGMPGK